MSAAPSFDSWQHHSACRGPHSVVFFPPPQFERKSERAERERRAKEICADCPVTRECLDYALQIREPHGVWGGLNEVERRVMIEEATAGVGG